MSPLFLFACKLVSISVASVCIVVDKIKWNYVVYC